MTTTRSGPHNAITDVPGVLVGHHQRTEAGWMCGTTVVLPPEGTVGGVDQRGGAPGTRETDLLVPENLVSTVDAVCLSGGSAFGLAAADGVMRWLDERNRGFPVGPGPEHVVPIVPAAVIFDLPRGDWGHRPDATFGYAACEAAAGGPVAQGSVGAGAGAQAGSLRGGVGTASEYVESSDGLRLTVGALAVVNAAGEVVRPGTGEPYAAEYGLDGEFGVSRWPERAGEFTATEGTRLNTTIGVVAVDAALSKAECRRLAVAAQDGIALAARPAHTMFDGDTVFALATGATELPRAEGPIGDAGAAMVLDRLCSAAARVFARAMVHGLLAASSAPGLPSYAEVWPEVFGDR
ncbi:P1 family peptidase [Saccharomonospora xinjiangensis]|uniref:P1 family peptidase n=1 Tax=Saccharomonospora xinjiangensis TaxID=75294 RepID=UPI00106FA64A|nr:P1 family peptidase [Saccharomonospora xinjiangensis]QBQ61575.1 Peptidase family S58 [Saccharomonospora xinjiangensis]